LQRTTSNRGPERKTNRVYLSEPGTKGCGTALKIWSSTFIGRIKYNYSQRRKRDVQ
jgi:hypothetical protein